MYSSAERVVAKETNHPTMSRLMIESFFPVNLAQAESYWLGDFLLNKVLFPPYVAELCPEVVLVLTGVAVRQPALAVSASLGVLVGLKGGYNLWKLTEKIKRRALLKTEEKELPNRRRRQLPSTRLWALAFVAFGLMNVSALPLHCLLSAPETTYPKEVSSNKATFHRMLFRCS